MTPYALVRPPPVRWREKGEMLLQGQADMDSSHGTRSLTGRRFESGDRSDTSGCGPLRLDRCAGARGPPARGAGAREPPAKGPGATAAAGRHDRGRCVATERRRAGARRSPRRTSASRPGGRCEATERRRAGAGRSPRRASASRPRGQVCRDGEEAGWGRAGTPSGKSAWGGTVPS